MSDFEEWIKYIFDRPLPEPYANAWYWNEPDEWVSRLDVIRSTEFLTQLFEQSASLLAPYSDAQLNQAFWYLVSDSSGSGYAFGLLDPAVSPLQQIRCIEVIDPLFAEVFARRCSPHLSHLDEAGANPLNTIVYMWWDVLPICGTPNDPARHEIDQTCLTVMGKVLGIDSLACQESALHGLGHWKSAYPEQVEKLIDDFLNTHPQVRAELKNYAMQAKTGYIL
jgi:hypothetical protein